MSRPVLFLLALAPLAAPVLCADEPRPVPKDTLPMVLPHDAVPLGLPDRPATPDNPLSAARAELGRKLFFDPILSADNTIACATCHRPEHGFSGPDTRPRGIGGRLGPRRAPTLFNRAYGTAFFWDGRTGTLEEQALEPIANPDEMGSSVPDAVARLKADAGYKKLFGAEFEDGVTAANLGKALAGFERVLLRGDSPVDRFRHKGQRSALTPSEIHGLWLYESKGRCWQCHSGANFTDEGFHNTGVSWGTSPPDLGREAVTKKAADRGKFKTPTLRGSALRAPYMHDGSVKTLDDVVEFYNRGGSANPNLDPVIRPLGLTKEETLDLVAFLKTL
jgi:cytochrome c peroxidase